MKYFQVPRREVSNNEFVPHINVFVPGHHRQGGKTGLALGLRRSTGLTCRPAAEALALSAG